MIPPHRRMLDSALARQLRADERARGVARRINATINAYWAEILELIPETPYAATRQQSRILHLTRQLNAHLQHQLTLELLGVGRWAHNSAARALTRRARTLVSRERFEDPREPDPEFGAVIFGPDGSIVRRPELLPTGRYDYSRLMIQPPSMSELTRIVGPAPLRLTKLFDPEKTARVIWQGISQGHDRRTIAKSLEKVLNNDAVAARRVARTEGLRVATHTQLAASEQIPDLITGYQVLATLDSRTRPEHRQRHGTIYHRNPKPGQKGFDQMPHPPIEADGTIAYNCRCMVAPVFADEPTPEVSYLLGTPYAGDAARNAGVLAV